MLLSLVSQMVSLSLDLLEHMTNSEQIFISDYAFQDPAILNMRMTPSSGGPPPPGMPFMGGGPPPSLGQMGMGSNTSAAYHTLDSVATSPLVDMVGYRDGSKDPK